MEENLFSYKIIPEKAFAQTPKNNYSKESHSKKPIKFPKKLGNINLNSF